MATYRSHAAKTRSVHQAEKRGAAMLPPRRANEKKPETAASFLTWPFDLFEKLMNPWRGNVMSVVSPENSWRVGNRITVPKSESRETDKAYHYLIDLPGVTREQISLGFRNGAIMLHVETAKEKRGKGSYYRDSHSIRRAFSLPVYTDAEAITANFSDGVLSINIPKTDRPVSVQSRTIDIT